MDSLFEKKINCTIESLFCIKESYTIFQERFKLGFFIEANFEVFWELKARLPTGAGSKNKQTKTVTAYLNVYQFLFICVCNMYLRNMYKVSVPMTFPYLKLINCSYLFMCACWRTQLTKISDWKQKTKRCSTDIQLLSTTSQVHAKN